MKAHDNLTPIIGSAAINTVLNLNAQPREVASGNWVVSGPFAVLCASGALFSGVDKICSWDDGSSPQLRYFAAGGGATYVLQLSARGSVISVSQLYQTKGSTSNVTGTTGVLEPLWLQDFKFAVTSNLNVVSGSVTGPTPFTPWYIGASWWDPSIPGLTTAPLQLQPFSGDPMYDLVADLTINNGASGSATWTDSAGTPTSGSLALQLALNQGDASLGQVGQNVVHSVVASDNTEILYICLALTSEVEITRGVLSVLEPQAAASGGSLVGLVLLGPVFSSGGVAAFTTYCDVPGVSPAGTIRLPNGADQLSIGILPLQGSGAFESLTSTPSTRAYLSRIAQQKIGNAPRLA